MGYRKEQRPVLRAQRGVRDTHVAATSAGTLAFGGSAALTSTSTDGTATVWDLATPLLAGQRMSIVTESIAATSSPQHVNAPSGFTFDGSTADMAVLSSGGCGVELLSLSTSQIGVVGAFGASFSTST